MLNHPQMDENFEPRMSLDGCTNSWFLRTYIGTFEHEFWISMTAKKELGGFNQTEHMIT